MESDKDNLNNAVDKDKLELPYEHCLNCGEKLNGMYCHKCGQKATSASPNIWAFLSEYANHAYIWDTKLLPTLWKLVSKPGYLTREFIAGKFVSYEHPLKMNMFLLFFFITMFLIFSNPDDIKKSVKDIAEGENVLPSLVFNELQNDTVYMAKMSGSVVDTITVCAPKELAASYPNILGKIGESIDSLENGFHMWKSAVPHVLVEDEILILDKNGYYIFNGESSAVEEMEDIKDVAKTLVSVFNNMMDIFTKYFPLIFILTVPFLSFAIKIIFRRRKFPFLKHFIFTLHYTALIELLIIVIYTIYLLASPSNSLLQWLFIGGSMLYLTLAIKDVYQVKRWYKAVIGSVFISALYMTIMAMVFLGIFIFACVSAVIA